MIDLTQFSIDTIIAQLKEINPVINWAHSKPFPKEESRWLSRKKKNGTLIFTDFRRSGSVKIVARFLLAHQLPSSFLRNGEVQSVGGFAEGGIIYRHLGRSGAGYVIG